MKKYSITLLILLASCISSTETKNEGKSSITNTSIVETSNFFEKRISNIDILVKSYSKDLTFYEDSLRIIRIAIYSSDLNESSKDLLAKYVDLISKKVDSLNFEHKKKTIPFDQTLNIYSYFNNLYNLKISKTSEITKLNGETINYMPGGIFKGDAILTIGNNNFSQLKACVIVLDNENCIYFSGNIEKSNSSFIYKAYWKSGYSADEFYPFKINFKKNNSGKEYIELKSIKHNGTLQIQFYK